MPDVFNLRVVVGLRIFGWSSAAAAVLLGLSVLLGWSLQSESLVVVSPGLPAMSPTTACMFVLSGLALAARRLNRPWPAVLLAALVSALGLLLLGGYVLGGDDLINPLLGARFERGGDQVIGRTAPATACGFLLLGLSLLLLDRSSAGRTKVAVACAVSGLLIATLAVIGYAYDVDGLAAVTFYRAVALHTALGQFVLFLATVLLEPERGWAAIIASGLPSGRATRVQLLLSTLVPFIIGLLVLRVADLPPSLGVAIVVVSTMIPLVVRILLDGRILDDVELGRREAERARQQLNEELEERVRERTERLDASEARLRQSQKMEAIGQLTGGLAHDFNNLLMGISGSLDMIATRSAQGRTQDLDRYIMAARGASRRAAALTHRLLSFSRRQTLDPRPTDLNGLVAGMDELVRRTMGPGIAVEVAADGGLWTTLIDPNQLENALLNLCINARDAMPDGGRLTIQTENCDFDDEAASRRELPAGQYVSLCVSDTGTGMPPEVVARAFDPFFTTKPIGLGTGLGLSMIYGFAQQSGGQARIHSELGRGTTVFLFLPRHDGQALSSEAPSLAKSADRAGPGQTVLVIDDEPAIRMLITDVLRDLGYTAVEAATGADGLRLLPTLPRIDLLITDVGLPGGMNGRQVADAARALMPELKIMFITGYAESALLSHGQLEAGMHVMTKPFAMELLASRIRTIIDATAEAPGEVPNRWRMAQRGRGEPVPR